MKIEFQSRDRQNLFPPVPALKVLPDKFKKIPSTNEDFMTVKHCMPMIEFLTSGYALLLRHDIVVKQKYKERNTFEDNFAVGLGIHPNEQMPIEINAKKNDYIKLPNAWVVKTPEGYSSMFYPVFGEERFKIFSGIVATDKYSTPVLLPGVLTTNEDFTIEAGTPIAMVFPFKRENWSSSITEWSPEIRAKSLEEEVLFSEEEHYYKKYVHVKSKYE